jgi:alcohol dehydrogenase
MVDFEEAEAFLREFKEDKYLHGIGVLPQVGEVVVDCGKHAVLICNEFPGSKSFIKIIKNSVTKSGVKLLGEIKGAKPNAPREDLARITKEVTKLNPDVLISFGGGSTIDATKAAEVLHTLGGGIDDYFGTGQVTAVLKESGKKLTPHVAIQTAASSGAHLTKYSNITDLETGQKKLIVDDSIVPQRPVFDYAVTFGAPPSLTADGALDGIAHMQEVLYGAVGKPGYQYIERVADVGIRLVVKYLTGVMKDPRYIEGRKALGLATDLGGYAIMLGGTNGAHLTSFSLIDILSHGRACAIMNP